MKSRRWIQNAFEQVVNKCKGTNFKAHDVTLALIPIMFNSSLSQPSTSETSQCNAQQISQDKKSKHAKQNFKKRKTVKFKISTKSSSNLLNSDIINEDRLKQKQELAQNKSPHSSRNEDFIKNELIQNQKTLQNPANDPQKVKPITKNKTQILHSIPLPEKDFTGKFKLLKLTIQILTSFIKQIYHQFERVESSNFKIQSELSQQKQQDEQHPVAPPELHSQRIKQLNRFLCQQPQNFGKYSKNNKIKQREYSIQQVKLQISQKLKDIEKCCQNVIVLKRRSYTGNEKQKLEDKIEEGWQYLRELLYILSFKATPLVNDLNL